MTINCPHMETQICRTCANEAVQLERERCIRVLQHLRSILTARGLERAVRLIGEGFDPPVRHDVIGDPS